MGDKSKSSFVTNIGECSPRDQDDKPELKLSGQVTFEQVQNGVSCSEQDDEDPKMSRAWRPFVTADPDEAYEALIRSVQ